jgi:Ca2+-binding RTX toxin-like protein
MRAVLALALFLALAAPARASTAEVLVGYECGTDQPCNRYGGGWSWAIVDYTAAPGEANRLTVANHGQTLVLTDPAATITAKAPCVSIDAHTASCDAGKPTFSADLLTVQLGDRDDTATIAPGPVPTGWLEGGAGDDVITGGSEDDTLVPGKGADRLDGGDGVDELNFGALHHPVTVDMAAGRTSEADRFTGIEAVRGGDRADRLLGGPGQDALYGGLGDDRLSGRGGKDELYGENGADRLSGGGDDDYLNGDPPQRDDGRPYIRLSPDVLYGGRGNDQLTDTGGANRMYGGPGSDGLTGGAGPDRLLGGRGTDDLRGHRGADRLSGGPGPDVVEGGPGADRLSGGSEADRLVGGPGADRLFGGSGPDDLFGIDRSRDRLDCGRGHDHAWFDAKDRLQACESLRRGGYTPFR